MLAKQFSQWSQAGWYNFGQCPELCKIASINKTSGPHNMKHAKERKDPVRNNLIINSASGSILRIFQFMAVLCFRGDLDWKNSGLFQSNRLLLNRFDFSGESRNLDGALVLLFSQFDAKVLESAPFASSSTSAASTSTAAAARSAASATSENVLLKRIIRIYYLVQQQVLQQVQQRWQQQQGRQQQHPHPK